MQARPRLCSPMRLAAVLAACSPALLFGCGDDAHKGTVSHGPTATATSSAAAAAAEPETRLKFDSGGPLSTSPVARRIRARLALLGIPKEAAKIVGAEVHVDVPNSKADAVATALAANRLDVYFAAVGPDPLAPATPKPPAGVSFGSESHGPPNAAKRRKFAVVDDSGKALLAKFVDQRRGANLGLLGPSYNGGKASGYRSYFADANRTIRGEQVTAVQVIESESGSRLKLELAPGARGRARWSSKQHAQFLLYVDGSVIATETPKLVEDGSLSFALPLTPPIAATKKLREIAKAQHRASLSHQVKLLKRAPR